MQKKKRSVCPKVGTGELVNMSNLKPHANEWQCPLVLFQSNNF